jgi:hypothetical protein
LSLVLHLHHYLSTTTLTLALALNASNVEEHAICYGVKQMKCEQIWNKPKPQTPTPNLTPTQQNTKHIFYSVRGDFWGMHREDLKGTEYLKSITF